MLSNDLEQLIEDRSKLENEVRIAQLDLDNSISLNEDAIQDNIRKESRLAELESIKLQLDADLPTDLRLLAVERTCLYDRYEYEIGVQSLQNETLRYRLLWRRDIEGDTEAVLQLNKQLRDEFLRISAEHADQMHGLNVALFKKEKKLEESFRTAALSAYRTHKERALISLSKGDLETLETRRNLLDELEIQQTAIACLRAKIAAHEIDCERMKLNCENSRDEAEILRYELSVAEGNGSIELVASAFKDDLFVNESISIPCEDKYVDYVYDRTTYTLWSDRRSSLLALKDEIRAFRHPKYGSISMGIEVRTSSDFGNYDDIKRNLKLLAAEHSELTAIAAPLIPLLEASILTSTPPTLENNAVLWIARQLLHIWSFSTSENDLSSVNSQLLNDSTETKWFAKKTRQRSDVDTVNPGVRATRFIDAGRGLHVLTTSGIPLPCIGRG